MDRLKSMEVFVHVVRFGGLAAGAKACGLSAAVAALHVRELEQRLGAKLLTRAGRRQCLTGVGTTYYAECTDVLARIESAEHSAKASLIRPVGHLRISAPTTFGSHLLMPLFAEYLREHRGVDVALELKDRPVDLGEDAIDAAFQFGAFAERGLVAHPLRGVRRILCASPDYLSQHGVPRVSDDLAGHECLAFHHDENDSLWPFSEAQGRRFDGRLTANNAVALVQAAVCGLGIVMLPEYLLAPEIAAGRLVQVLADAKVLLTPLQLVYSAERHMSSKLQSFVDFMLGRLGPEVEWETAPLPVTGGSGWGVAT